MKYQIYDEIVDELFQQDLNEIAAEAEVSITTLKNWCSGKTKAPKIDTLYKVATAIDMDIILMVKVKSQKLRLVR